MHVVCRELGGARAYQSEHWGCLLATWPDRGNVFKDNDTTICMLSAATTIAKTLLRQKSCGAEPGLRSKHVSQDAEVLPASNLAKFRPPPLDPKALPAETEPLQPTQVTSPFAQAQVQGHQDF